MTVSPPRTPSGRPGKEERRAAGRTAPPGDGPAPATRRDVVRGLLAPAALAVTLAPVTAAAAGPAPSSPRARTAHPAPAFDETYLGRRIRGFATAPADLAAGADAWQVTVDGRPLHLLRRADGTWLTMVDHYRSYPTPLEAARAAVDELGPGRHLRATDHHHAGGGHGVHA